MKQYKDGVFIKVRDMVWTEYLEVEGCGLEQIEEPVIVLTLKDLEDVWEAAEHYMSNLEFGHYAVSFQEYMKSKGISL